MTNILQIEKPPIDTGAKLWLTQVEAASQRDKSCSVPTKYFSILEAWGLVTGPAGATRLTGAGLSLVMTEKNEASELKKASKPKSAKRKRK